MRNVVKKIVWNIDLRAKIKKNNKYNLQKNEITSLHSFLHVTNFAARIANSTYDTDTTQLNSAATR